MVTSEDKNHNPQEKDPSYTMHTLLAQFILLTTFCYRVHCFQARINLSPLRDHGSEHLRSLCDKRGCPAIVRSTTVGLHRRDAIVIATSVTLGILNALVPYQPALAFDTTLAPITDKVVVNVRIARQDGTFYVRDDLEDTPENKVYYGQLTLGLYGHLEPKAVKEFLSYVDVEMNEDSPLPSYARSSFVSLDQSTGLLLGGQIPSLEVTELAGSTALKYGGRILPAPLWFDGMQTERISHTKPGLLTRRTLDVTPTFCLTTRPAAELDATYTVFGQLLMDDTSKAFLDIVQDIPTYSLEKPRGDPRQETVMDNVATAVFNSQREIFRSAAQTFGDSRVSKVYPGKLLRRVEVTEVHHVR